MPDDLPDNVVFTTRPVARFALEAWPAGTRARAMRRALHYRAAARAWRAQTERAWRAQDAAMHEAWRAQARSAELFRRVVELEGAIREHRRLVEAGVVGEAQRTLWAALGEGEG